MRRHAGFLNQSQFAKALGVKQSTVQRWESGKFAPKQEHLEKLSKLLGVTPDQILSYETDAVGADLPHDAVSDMVGNEPSRRSLEGLYRVVTKVTDDKKDLVEKLDSLERKIQGLESVLTKLPDGVSGPELLSKFAILPPALQKIALTVIHQDRSYLKGISPRLRADIARAVAALFAPVRKSAQK